MWVDDFIQALASDIRQAFESVAGDVEFNSSPGGTVLGRSLRCPNELVPTALTTSQSDYSPFGLTDAVFLWLTSTGAVSLRGLGTGAPGRWLFVYNGGSNTITLTNQDSASLAANRIVGRDGADTDLTSNTGAWLYYSPSQLRWLVSEPPGGSGGGVPTSRQIISGTGLSGGGDLSADRTISLANTAVTPGSYTSANITVDAQGRLTAASNGSGGGPAIQSFTYTITGSEPDRSDLTITLPVAMANTNYVVTVQPMGCASIPAFDVPTADKTTTTFRVIATGVLTTGDVLGFLVVAFT